MEEKRTSTLELPRFKEGQKVTVVSEDNGITLPMNVDSSTAEIIEIRMNFNSKSDIITRISVENHKRSNVYRKLNFLYGVK